jgi:hypothetical protein
VGDGDDVDVVEADAVDHDVWEATNFELPRDGENSSGGTNVRVVFD